MSNLAYLQDLHTKFGSTTRMGVYHLCDWLVDHSILRRHLGRSPGQAEKACFGGRHLRMHCVNAENNNSVCLAVLGLLGITSASSVWETHRRRMRIQAIVYAQTISRVDFLHIEEPSFKVGRKNTARFCCTRLCDRKVPCVVGGVRDF